MSRSHAWVGAAVAVAAVAGMTLPAVAATGAAPPAPSPRGEIRPVPAAPTTVASYTLIAPATTSKSQLVARAILRPGRPCPPLLTRTAAGAPWRSTATTQRRVGPLAAPAFASVKVCSAMVPVGVTQATLGGRQIPAAIPASVTRIGITADSGCKVKGSKIQDCNNGGWPLAGMAAGLASMRPQVVFEPGDYYYRDEACPKASWAKCGVTPPVEPTPGMPFTDNAHGWLVDAITPMTPLFAAAPLALLRGNHEACDRAGNGFFLFFDPRLETATECEPVDNGGTLEPPKEQVTPPWTFTLPVAQGRALKVAMVDTAYGSDDTISKWAKKGHEVYLQADAMTTPQPGIESWLMTHRPLFGRTPGNGEAPNYTPWASNNQAAGSQGLLGHYQMVLSSHIHLLQAVQIKGLPPNLIVGAGGTMLDPRGDFSIPGFGPLAKSDGTAIDPKYPPYPTASMLWTKVRYGFGIATASPTRNAWNVELQGLGSTHLATCKLRNPSGTAPDLACS